MTDSKPAPETHRAVGGRIDRNWIIGLALLGAVTGFFAAPVLHARLMPIFYSSYLAGAGTDAATASLAFSAGLAAMLAMIFISGIVTEKGVHMARYVPAILKSMFVAALIFGMVTLYEDQSIKSRQRLGAQLHQTFPHGGNPLVASVWTTAIALLLFGPLDLWIAHRQAQQKFPRFG